MALVFSLFPFFLRRLKCIIICCCHRKEQKQHILLSYFKTLSVSPAWGLNSQPPTWLSHALQCKLLHGIISPLIFSIFTYLITIKNLVSHLSFLLHNETHGEGFHYKNNASQWLLSYNCQQNRQMIIPVAFSQ